MTRSKTACSPDRSAASRPPARSDRAAWSAFVFLFSTIVALLATIQTTEAQTTRPEWRRVAPLPEGVSGHRAVLLPTGEVLVSGGIRADGAVTRSSFLYSPFTGAFRPTVNQLNTARAGHALVDVTVGGVTRVFAIGGYGGATGNYRGEASVEILESDGAGNWRWRPIGALTAGRGDLRATWDGAGAIVVTGGYESSGGALRTGTRSTITERIDIATLAITTAPAMNGARAEHLSARIIDENGVLQILVAGGETNPAATATQIFEAGIWNAIANPPLAYHTAGVGVGDPAGIARIFGGLDATGAPGDACEWYDVKRGWRTAPRMNAARARFDATLVAGLSDTALAYLVGGGQGASGAIASTELFALPNGSAPNGAWTPFPALRDAGSERELVIGGANLPIAIGGVGALQSVEVYQPLSADDIAFGAEEVGRRSDSVQMVIRNTWLLPVRVRNVRIEGAPFFFRGDTADFVIQPGGSRSLRVYFQPGSTGRHDGRMLFDVGELTDTVRLSGNGIASTLAVINSPFDAGAVFIGRDSSYCFYALQNNGTDTAVIDSVVIDPSTSFRLVAPKGRASIPPGDSLLVCVLFDPIAQGSTSTVLSIHLAARTFPAQIIGQGVRRRVQASVLTAECDTIAYAPGAAISSFITLRNTGDSAVRVDLPVLSQSVIGLFEVADPSLFPLTLQPGETRQIEIVFRPIRESREEVVVTFPNNGDTTAAVSLCVVARSRFLSVSQSTIDVGTVCIGDTITTTLLMENPGSFDTITLQSVTATPAGEVTLIGFTPTVLAPRAVARMTVRYIPTGTGPLAGTITITNDRGDVTVPIVGDAQQALRFRPVDTDVAIGGRVVVPVVLEGLPAGDAVTAATLALSYDPTLLLPIRIVPLDGIPPVDIALSDFQITGRGEGTLTLVWSGAGATGNGNAFGLEVEGLRGSARVSGITLGAESLGSYCVESATGVVSLLPPCWGDGGFVQAAKASLLFVTPNPASDVTEVTIVVPADSAGIRLVISDAIGRDRMEMLPAHVAGNTWRATFAASELEPGIYLIRAESAAGVVGTTRVLVR